MTKTNQIMEIITQKFILELNAALAMENAGVERLQTRIQEVSLPDAKSQIEHHLQESKEHQKRLQQLITNMGGEPTIEKIGLPLPSYPQTIFPDDDRFYDQTGNRTKKDRRRLDYRKCRSSLLSYANRKGPNGRWCISKYTRATVA